MTAVWADADRAWLEQRLARVNGHRTARRLEAGEVIAAVARLERERLPFVVLHGGDVEDARQRTSLALVVKTDAGVVVGVAESRTGPATPARAFSDLDAWDVWVPHLNLVRAERWAARETVDRRRLSEAARATDLMAAIRAAPDDDRPRLVLADRLMDEGDPRGEFIAVQCALAQAERTKRGDGGALLEKEVALLTAHREQWLRGLAHVDANVTFRRGFVDEIAVFSLEAFDAAQGFLGEELVQRLVLMTRGAVDVAALLRWEWLTDVRALTFKPPRDGLPQLRPDALAMLAGTRRLRGLNELALVSQHLGDEAATTLARSDAFPSLTEFRFSHDELSVVGLEALLDAPWFLRLESLTLVRHELGPDAARALAGASLKRLRALTLSSNRLGDEGAQALATARGLPRLESLWLTSNRVGLIGAQALLSSKALRGVALHLDSNQLPARLMEEFARHNERLGASEK